MSTKASRRKLLIKEVPHDRNDSLPDIQGASSDYMYCGAEHVIMMIPELWEGGKIVKSCVGMNDDLTMGTLSPIQVQFLKFP